MGDSPLHWLACENDPVALGIKDERSGKWDIDVLIDHIDQCPKCKEYYTDLLLRSPKP